MVIAQGCKGRNVCQYKGKEMSKIQFQHLESNWAGDQQECEHLASMQGALHKEEKLQELGVAP